jgi:hypothetical protein
LQLQQYQHCNTWPRFTFAAAASEALVFIGI